jgi:putrescine transport system substrate-binding protein
VKIECSVPVEGAQLWSDNLVLVKDGNHSEQGLAHPEVIAPATDLALTANANKDANTLVPPEVQEIQNTHPSKYVIAVLFTLQPHPMRSIASPRAPGAISRMATEPIFI